MTFEQKWIEYDFNPFIIFNSKKKVVSLNSEAQFLLGHINSAIVFDIAMTYASQSFGFKTTFVDLEFGRYKFFGLTVGYENEKELAVRLYQLPSFKFSKPATQNSELINIYTLIDLCISTNSINKDIKFIKKLDPSMPEVRLNVKGFIKLLNTIYLSFLNAQEIATQLFFRVGEHIKFENEKYSLFCLKIDSQTSNITDKNLIISLAKKSNLYITINQQEVLIDIPLICK